MKIPYKKLSQFLIMGFVTFSLNLEIKHRPLFSSLSLDNVLNFLFVYFRLKKLRSTAKDVQDCFEDCVQMCIIYNLRFSVNGINTEEDSLIMM